jgi:tetratricopeptide (TPR) repeat protein
MKKEHPGELDLLDYVQNRLSASETAATAKHASECRTCERRIEGMRRLSAALPFAGVVLGMSPPPRASAEDAALFAQAERMADEKMAQEHADEKRVRAWFSDPAAPEPPANPSAAEIAAGLRVARELLRSDTDAAAPIVRWAYKTVTEDSRGEYLPVQAPARATFAQLLQAEGRPREALDEMTSAKPFLPDCPTLDEEARWEYVRATILHNRSQYEEARAGAQRAAKLYLEWEDDNRWRRSKMLEAAILSDAERAKEALPIYNELLGEPWPDDDRVLEAICAHNYACDLLIAGELAKVKPAFARSTDLLRKTGQEKMLFRVRTALADLAMAEGRLTEALDLNVRLRKEFTTRALPWDEVQRELRIAELQIRLGRSEEARATCMALVSRARELDLPEEASRALAYLAEAAEEFPVESVVRVARFLKERSRNPEAIWSAA